MAPSKERLRLLPHLEIVPDKMPRYLRPSTAPPPPKTVHIAVDCGTTFTAAAYAIDHGIERPLNTTDIRIVTKWPNGNAISSREVNDVPTELQYTDGQQQPVAHGWEARNMLKTSKRPDRLRKTRATRFKLLLSLKENTKTIREDLERRILTPQRSVIDLFVHFLVYVRIHVLHFIQTSEDEEEEFKKWNLRWTLTVPADWSPHARRQMKEAALRAGYEGEIKLISEPEAASIYILERRGEERKKLTLEHAVVVGDLGGGTMDCATYQIASLAPLSLSGLAHVQGRICGSGNLNDEFRRHMRARLAGAFDDYLQYESRMTFSETLDRLEDWFETEKRGFQGTDGRPCYAPVGWLREDEKSRFAPLMVELSNADMLSIFDPVVKEVVDLINNQIVNSINSRMKAGVSKSEFKVEKKVFLTGGLAANPYVQHRVKTVLEEEQVHGYRIPVVSPPSPETAVVMGAVWRSLCPELVTRRLSETSYGFKRVEQYTTNWRHGGPGPVKNQLTGAMEMRDRVKWVIKQGEAFKVNDRVAYRLERFVPVGGPVAFEESLFYSDTVSKDYVHWQDFDIHFLGTVPFDLEKWRNRFQIKTNEIGQRYMVIEYELISIFAEDEWRYGIEVMQGKTRFKDCTNIQAALKLTQGFVHN